MITITARASKENPCQVCNTGTKGCSVTDNGLHFCRGIASITPVGWQEVRNGADDNSFRHFRRDEDRRSVRKPRRATKPQVVNDLRPAAERYAAAMNEDHRAEIAIRLQLPIVSLKVLPLIGVNGHNYSGHTFTFPETDADGRVTGIIERFPDSTKRMQKGGHRGLTIPDGLKEMSGPVFVVEGASDVLAAVLVGLAAVGRPNNAGGVEMLAELLRDVSEIIIVGENDRKADGSWPGKSGAEAVAKKLANLLLRPIKVAFPPDGVKDIRDWLIRDGFGSEFRQHFEKTAGQVEPTSNSSNTVVKKPTVVDKLIEIGLAAELFHDKGGTAYAMIGRGQTLKVKSSRFRSWLMSQYYNESGKGVSGEAVTSAVSTIEAFALSKGNLEEVHVRIAWHEGTIIVNLGDAAGNIVKVDKDGWKVDTSSPVRFLDTPNSSPLPIPENGGNISELRRFINCPDDSAFALLLGWIVAAYLRDGPYLLLVLTGEQGSAKSTTARVLKDLIDPERVRDRSLPKDLRDLAIWASCARLLSVDNVSFLHDWLSDAFCRLSTGGGFATRRLFTDEEEAIFDNKRPLILNGIEEVARRGDLLERSIVLQHPAISESTRRSESDLWSEFENAKPKFLGAIFDRLSAGLRAIESMNITSLPRMADAARWAVACEFGMNEQPRFLDAFGENQLAMQEMMLEDSIIVEGLLKFVGRCGGEWTGTATELLRGFMPDKVPESWPKTPGRLSGLLRRLAPALLKCYGLTVTTGRKSGGKRIRTIQLSFGRPVS